MDFLKKRLHQNVFSTPEHHVPVFLALIALLVGLTFLLGAFSSNPSIQTNANYTCTKGSICISANECGANDGTPVSKCGRGTVCCKFQSGPTPAPTGQVCGKSCRSNADCVGGPDGFCGSCSSTTHTCTTLGIKPTPTQFNCGTTLGYACITTAWNGGDCTKSSTSYTTWTPAPNGYCASGMVCCQKQNNSGTNQPTQPPYPTLTPSSGGGQYYLTPSPALKNYCSYYSPSYCQSCQVNTFNCQQGQYWCTGCSQ